MLPNRRSGILAAAAVLLLLPFISLAPSVEAATSNWGATQEVTVIASSDPTTHAAMSESNIVIHNATTYWASDDGAASFSEITPTDDPSGGCDPDALHHAITGRSASSWYLAWNPLQGNLCQYSLTGGKISGIVAGSSLGGTQDDIVVDAEGANVAAYGWVGGGGSRVTDSTDSAASSSTSGTYSCSAGFNVGAVAVDGSGGAISVCLLATTVRIYEDAGFVGTIPVVGATDLQAEYLDGVGWIVAWLDGTVADYVRSYDSNSTWDLTPQELANGLSGGGFAMTDLGGQILAYATDSVGGETVVREFVSSDFSTWTEETVPSAAWGAGASGDVQVDATSGVAWLKVVDLDGDTWLSPRTAAAFPTGPQIVQIATRLSADGFADVWTERGPGYDVWSRERYFGDSSSRGNVWRFDTDLNTVWRADPCVGDSFWTRTSNTILGMGVDSANRRSWTLCHNIVDNTNVLRERTPAGQLNGYSPSWSGLPLTTQVEALGDLILHTTGSQQVGLYQRNPSGDLPVYLETWQASSAPGIGIEFVNGEKFAITDSTSTRVYGLADQFLDATIAQDGEWVQMYDDQVLIYDGFDVFVYTENGTSYDLTATHAWTLETDVGRISTDGTYLTGCSSTFLICQAIEVATGNTTATVTPTTGTPRAAMFDYTNERFYIATDGGLEAWEVKDFTSAFGDSNNGGAITVPVAGHNPNVNDGSTQTSTSSTTTGSGAGIPGVGGDGGFVGDPGGGIFGDAINQASQDTGIPASQFAWILGIFLVMGVTVGFAMVHPSLGIFGLVLGIGFAVGLSLLPLWIAVILGVAAVAALMYTRSD